MPGTGRAARAASTAPGTAPELLGVWLLSGALLVLFWILAAAPAHADGTDGATPLTAAVPTGVASPVTAVLGTVHAGLEGPTARTATVLPSTAEALGTVGDGARHVVQEIGHVPPTGSVAVLTTAPSPGPDPANIHAPHPGAGARTVPDTGHASPPEPPAAARTAPPPDAPAAALIPAHPPAPDTGRAAATSADTEPVPAPETESGPAATGAPGSVSAPGIAGYLTSTYLAAPAAALVRAPGSLPRTVPGGPTDDPTVSPD
ncbi:hypothetical protein [Nocardiopsis sp. CNT312]|uniref:hypothetical protein n=1 Tax=Nocardiopsis sp. CNT312 TaxID=1137268 RepID=UPI00048B3B05|nr:hypothetical protein [Nocardiopsis sp. CNT312]